MIKSIRTFFSDKIYQPFHSLGSRVHRIINRKNDDCSFAGVNNDRTTDHLLMNSFANTPKTLPPKFDSIADRLMENISISHTESNHDQQQLFLQTHKNSRTENCTEQIENTEILEQLKQLIKLLQTITSEHSETNFYNTSFLREIIHNIYLDLHVMLSNLDIKLMIESDAPHN